MASGRKGLVFALLALVVLIAGAGLWTLRSRRTAPVSGRLGPEGARPSIFASETGEDRKAAAGVIEGVVNDAAGAGIAGAAVVLTRRRGPDTSPFQMMRPVATAVTGAGGGFRFDKLAPADYGLTAAAARFAPGERAPIAVGEGVERVTLTLSPGGLLLSGRVSDAGGGPVPGAIVRATLFAGNGQIPRFYQASTDAGGLYQLALAKGSYGLMAEAEGYAPIRDGITLARDEKRDLRLMPAARLYGRVVERATRQPVPDAEVWLVTDRRYDQPGPRDVKTDAEGNFAFNDLPPASYAVAARKGRLAGYSSMTPVSPMQAVTDVVVEVDPGLAVRGQVVDPDGKPLGGVRLYLSKREPPFDRGAAATSEPSGAFTVEGVFAGQYSLSTTKEGFATVRKDLKVAARDVEGVVVKLAPGAVLAGTVVTASGKPAPGAQVWVELRMNMDAGGRMQTMRADRSDADGKFEVKDLEAAQVTVKAKHPEEGAGSLDTFALGTGEKKLLKIVLGGGASIAGTVRCDDGTPAAGVRVNGYQRTAGGGSRSEEDVSGQDGSFKLSGLRGGTFDVSARRDNAEMPNRTTVTVAENEQKTGVLLEIPKGGLSISGQVVASDGTPVVGATVNASAQWKGQAMRFGPRDGRTFLTGEGGSFVIEDLTKGTYTVSAFHSNHAEGELKDVEAGAKAVRVQLPAEASMAGVVAGSDNQPVTDYTVALLPGPTDKETGPERTRRLSSAAYQSPVRRIHDPAGGFSFDRLRAASYELKVTTGDGRSGSSVVTLHSGEKKAGLRITLAAGVRIVGRVVDLDGGHPLAGASVSAMAVGTPSRPDAVKTGADGAFALENVVADQPLRVQAFADGFVNDGPELEAAGGKGQIDVGTIKLIHGDVEARYAPGERGVAGFGTAIRDGRPVVLNVMKGGAAEKAGVRAGDTVVAIDGRDTRELGPGSVRYLLAGKPGTAVSVEVQSGAESPRKVTVTRFDPESARR